uniref:hypothetical protein n=2 Tax=[Ruminococcus] torques TaxID=33039 RepID=UPI003AB4CD3E
MFMRKIVRIISVMALGIAMFVPTTAFASSNSDAILVSTEQVTLTSSEGTTRSAENKKFILKTYDDNGATVYSFDVENEEYRQAAMEYINKLTGDPGPSPQTRGPLLPGQSEYHNDTQYEGAAMSYAWKRNTASTWGNNFEGGQSSSWTGSGKCNYIVLNQGISINGIAVSIT